MQTPNSTSFDATGRKHIFKLRGDNYRSTRRSLNKKLKLEKNCCHCNELDQYISTLEKSSSNIEQQLNYLTELSNMNLQRILNSDTITNEKVNLSELSIDELLRVSISI
ncbi:hypothetical protein G9A89_011533 [Geosiphon pyriformis]|nr:hypothetical protein G9A89_011533 [Geosiphon pyriformis]